MFQREGPLLQSLDERLALQVLHHQEIGAVLVTHVVERANVGMVQGRNRTRFALEALAEIGHG